MKSIAATEVSHMAGVSNRFDAHDETSSCLLGKALYQKSQALAYLDFCSVILFMCEDTTEYPWSQLGGSSPYIDLVDQLLIVIFPG